MMTDSLPQKALSDARTQLIKRISTMSPSDLVSFVKNDAKRTVDVPIEVWQYFVERAIEVADLASAEHITTILHLLSVTKLKHAPLLTRFSQEITLKLPQFSDEALAVALHTYGQFKHYGIEEKAMFTAVRRRFHKPDHSPLSPEIICSLLFSFSRCKLHPVHFFTFLSNQIVKDMSEIQTSDLATCVIALSNGRMAAHSFESFFNQIDSEFSNRIPSISGDIGERVAVISALSAMCARGINAKAKTLNTICERVGTNEWADELPLNALVDIIYFSGENWKSNSNQFVHQSSTIDSHQNKLLNNKGSANGSITESANPFNDNEGTITILGQKKNNSNSTLSASDETALEETQQRQALGLSAANLISSGQTALLRDVQLLKLLKGLSGAQLKTIPLVNEILGAIRYLAVDFSVKATAECIVEMAKGGWKNDAVLESLVRQLAFRIEMASKKGGAKKSGVMILEEGMAGLILDALHKLDWRIEPQLKERLQWREAFDKKKSMQSQIVEEKQKFAAQAADEKRRRDIFGVQDSSWGDDEYGGNAHEDDSFMDKLSSLSKDEYLYENLMMESQTEDISNTKNIHNNYKERINNESEKETSFVSSPASAWSSDDQQERDRILSQLSGLAMRRTAIETHENSSHLAESKSFAVDDRLIRKAPRGGTVLEDDDSLTSSFDRMVHDRAMEMGGLSSKKEEHAVSYNNSRSKIDSKKRRHNGNHAPLVGTGEPMVFANKISMASKSNHAMRHSESLEDKERRNMEDRLRERQETAEAQRRLHQQRRDIAAQKLKEMEKLDKARVAEGRPFGISKTRWQFMNRNKDDREMDADRLTVVTGGHRMRDKNENDGF